MDPDETLAALRLMAAAVFRVRGDVGQTEKFAIALAEAAQSLDEWLSKGGFLPSAWEPK